MILALLPENVNMTPPYLKKTWDFSGGPEVKNLPCHARDVDSVPGLGRFRMPWGNHALQLRLDTVKLYIYIYLFIIYLYLYLFIYIIYLFIFIYIYLFIIIYI